MTNKEWKEIVEEFLAQILDLNNDIPNSVTKVKCLDSITGHQYYVAKTIFGDYRFRLEFNGGRKYNGFTVFGRFLQKVHFKDAASRLNSNPFSGKWNLHIYEKSLGHEHFFLNDLEKIVEETKQS